MICVAKIGENLQKLITSIPVLVINPGGNNEGGDSGGDGHGRAGAWRGRGTTREAGRQRR